MKHWARIVLDELLWDNRSVSDHTRTAIAKIVRIIEERDVHDFRTTELEEIAENLSLCTDLMDLSYHMWSITTSLGFQHFAIFVLSQGSGVCFEPRICTSFPQQWINRYVERRYQYIDPIMLRASKADGAFLFSSIASNSPMAKDFWTDAEEHGIGTQGVCFAMTKRNGSRIGISFSTSDKQERVEETFQLNAFDMNMLTNLASDAFCFAASGPDLPDDTLNVDELRFLQVLAKSPNPQDALRVSACFGSNKTLQASIKAKLRVESIFQAIAVTASKGWFDALPYDTKEIHKPFSPLVGLENDTLKAPSRQDADETQGREEERHASSRE